MKINPNINKINFVDIETVPNDEGMTPDLKKAWEVFAKDEKVWKDHAALHAEYGKIVCISMGYFDKDNVFKKKSYCGPDERQILLDFFNDYTKLASMGIRFICGHNIKAFDIPFIIKRATILGIWELPEVFELNGKKPWELDNFIDTLEIWRCGSFQGGGSLRTLCACMGLPNPKLMKNDQGELVEQDGKMVSDQYAEKDYAGISTYCEGDIMATANVLNTMCGRTDLILQFHD